MRSISQTHTKSGGLDVFRLIAAVIIIAIHTSPLESFNQDADFFLTRILSRIAVPFFFMVTGQFVVSDIIRKKTGHGRKTLTGGKDISDSRNISKLTAYIKKIALIYAAAIIIYIPIGIYAGHYNNLSVAKVLKMLIFDGTFYHLWYFSACIIGCILIFTLSRFMSLTAMTAVFAVLYIIGLFGDSYFGVIKNIPAIETVYDWLFNIFSYTRNGLFFAPFFLLMGVWMRRLHLRLRHKACVSGFIISLCAMTAEGFALHLNHMQRHDSMYFMLIPTMFFLYQLLLQWRLPQKPAFRPLSAIVYVIHPAIIIAVRAIAKPLHLSSILVENSLVHFLAVTLLSFLTAFLFVYFISGSFNPFKHGKIKPPRNTASPAVHMPTDDGRTRAWIELDRAALAKNVYFLQSLIPNGELMPAVKADAYGHGAVIISKELNKLGINSFCVACADEAVELRKNGIKGDILILGYTSPHDFYLLRRYNLIQTVVDYEYACRLNQYGKPIRVHLGIDTGMHRLGIRSEDTDEILKFFSLSENSASGFKNLKTEGIFTHLSADDSLYPAQQAFTANQVLELKKLTDTLKSYGIDIPKVHLLSSYGLLNYPQLAGDYARVGIALYGVLSSKDDTELWQDSLTPVLSLKARISSVRTLHKGECAGYSMAFTAHREMKISALTIGYADGLPRNLSNGGGYVLINGKRAPIIGLICMDQTIVDVSAIEDVKAGDIAVIIGKSGDMTIKAAELAENSGTITNELLSRLGKRLKRIAV